MREAAEHLRIAQSAISRQIQNLEIELSCTVFERGPRGVTLTAAGEALLRFIRESNHLGARLQDEINRLNGIQRGHLVVATVEGFATGGFPDALSRFTQMNPAVTLEVIVANSTSIAPGVSEDRHDIGVLFNPHDERLNIVASVKAPLSALMAPWHPCAKRGQLSLRDLHGYPLVAPARYGGSRELYEAACRLARRPLQPVLETNSAHIAAAFLRSTDGIAVMSPRMAVPYLQSGQLVALQMRERTFSEGILAVVTRSGRRLSSAGEILCAMLAKALVKLEAEQSRMGVFK